jgi:choline dehydrogenase-like flavoprotein
VRFKARKVVVAAGALSSSALLLQSNLRGLSGATGKFLTLHPALTSFGRAAKPIRGFDGFPKLYFTDAYSESHHYYLETAFYFPFVTAKSLPGFGEELKRFMRSYANLTCALTLVHDEAEEHNAIVVKGGRATLEYRLSPASRAAIVHAQRTAGRIFFAGGVEEYVSPVSHSFGVHRAEDLDRVIDERALRSGKVVVSSAHPMGGCRMGSDERSSVTDAWGRVHNHPNIVVADASLFPTSSKVNPFLTVMALAERNAEQIASELD